MVACEYVNVVLLGVDTTVVIPLKLESPTPWISTASPICNAWDCVVVTVTVPETRETPVAAIGVTVCWLRSTIESTPAPPGLTSAQFSFGETATRVLIPVLTLTVPATAGVDPGHGVRSRSVALFVDS